MKKLISVFLIMVFIVSCSGASSVKGYGYNMINLYEVNSMAPSIQYSVLEKCPQVMKKETDWDYEFGKETITEKNVITTIENNCELINIQFTTQSGVISGALGPVIQAGGIVGGAYFIGNGLADSGNTTQLNNSASAMAGANSFAKGGNSTNNNTLTAPNNMPMPHGD